MKNTTWVAIENFIKYLMILNNVSLVAELTERNNTFLFSKLSQVNIKNAFQLLIFVDKAKGSFLFFSLAPEYVTFCYKISLDWADEVLMNFASYAEGYLKFGWRINWPEVNLSKKIVESYLMIIMIKLGKNPA